MINVNVNKIVNIDALADFQKVNYFYCIENRLTSFPACVCDLPLKYLSLKKNKR